jgi:hypothetical protein
MAHFFLHTVCGRGSAVEHRLAKARVAGSIPVVRSIYAPLAQLDRAFDYESKGREFESLRARHYYHIHELILCRRGGMADALDSKSRGKPWRFESSRRYTKRVYKIAYLSDFISPFSLLSNLNLWQFFEAAHIAVIALYGNMGYNREKFL